MSLTKDKLQIILITYNREAKLKNTLEQVFAADSPIKDFDITIMDNVSTDGTEQLIREYCQRFPNISYVRHRINIGGNANICRAFELGASSGKEYFWVLCDDDDYDWTYWSEIEEAIQEDRDVILAERLSETSDLPIEVIVNELNFLPAGIYKSEIVSPKVILNAYANIYNSLPHQALVAEVINKGYKFFVPKHTVIIQNVNKGSDCGYKRGYKGDIHPRIAHFNLFSGMLNSYQMIEDPVIRQKCCGCLFLGKSFRFSMKTFLALNGRYPNNICDVFFDVDFKKKLIFLWVLLFYLVNPFINFSITEKGLYINLFNKLRTRLLPRRCLFWVR